MYAMISRQKIKDALSAKSGEVRVSMSSNPSTVAKMKWNKRENIFLETRASKIFQSFLNDFLLVVKAEFPTASRVIYRWESWDSCEQMIVFSENNTGSSPEEKSSLGAPENSGLKVVNPETCPDQPKA